MTTEALTAINPNNPMSFFDQNVDQWGAAEWFDRLAKAVRKQDKAVVEKDDVAFETYRMIASSSALALVREHEATVRAALTPTVEKVETPAQGNPAPQAQMVGPALRILQEGIDGAEADMQSDSDAGERVDLFDYEISLPYETAREIATLLRAPAPQNHVTAEEQRLRKIVLDLQNERLVMIEALKPFAACADEINHDDKERDEPTSDDEWAKFRLLVSDSRGARAALNVRTYNASPSSNERYSTHHVHRGPESLPCYCAATSDHSIGKEQTHPPQTNDQVKQAFLDGLAYATNCEVADPEEAWRTSSTKARQTPPEKRMSASKADRGGSDQPLGSNPTEPALQASRDAMVPPKEQSVLGSIDGFKTFTPSSESLREYISEVGAIEGPKIGDGCLPPFFEDFGSAFIRQHRDIGMHNDLRENMRARSSPSRREIGDNIELERQSEIAMAPPPQTNMREV